MSLGGSTFFSPQVWLLNNMGVAAPHPFPFSTAGDRQNRAPLQVSSQQPDLISHTSLLGAYDRDGRWESALQHLLGERTQNLEVWGAVSFGCGLVLRKGVGVFGWFCWIWWGVLDCLG